MLLSQVGFGLYIVWHVEVLTSASAPPLVILVAVCGLPTSDKLCQLPSLFQMT